MALASNIVRRGGSGNWYVRTSIPSDIHGMLPEKWRGRTELWQSLRTADAREARLRAGPVLHAWRAEFDDLRKRREPQEADLQEAIIEHYRWAIDRDRAERLSFPTKAELETARLKLLADIEAGKVPWSDDPLVQLSATLELQAAAGQASRSQELRAQRLGVLRRDLATGESASVEHFADYVIESERLLIERGSPAYRDLCHRLVRAEIEALQRAEERDRGDWSGEPRDVLLKPANVPKSAPQGETIMELFDRFQRDKAGSATVDTWDQNRKIVKLFAEFLGETAHISTFKRKAVRDFKDALFKFPVRAADTNVFRGLSFRKTIEANATAGKPTLSHRTINRYLSAIGAFSRWCLANDFISEDVMAGQYLDVDKSERKRLPYSVDQLNAIFASPIFAGFLRDGDEHKPGNLQPRDWRFWLPLIGLFTGARLGEIAQLLVTDVRPIHGTWVFHVTREGSTRKSVKTGGSERVIPIHSELIRCGFLAYHASMLKRGEKQLFPEIEPDSRGFFSGNPSRFFGRYLRAIGVKGDNSVNFHSFRHGIADAFRRAGYLDEQFGMLLGHTKATTTGRYGILPEGQLAQRTTMIEAVAYPGLALATLYK